MYISNRKKTQGLFLSATVVALLAGCGASKPLSARISLAEDLAAKASLSRHTVPAGLFDLAAWMRMEEPGTTARVYIEGDGLAFVSRHQVSLNPTPVNPVALRLASQDLAPNVVYLARPCQFSGWRHEGACPDKYWTSHRTAKEVIESYQDALNEIKTRHAITHFELIGYSGGAAIALLLAAERNDVESVRTVAGNIDYKAFADFHRVSPMTASIDPATVAEKIKDIPQIHYIGGKDKIIPKALFDGWKEKSLHSSCVQSIKVENATHETGWEEDWRRLLNVSPKCP